MVVFGNKEILCSLISDIAFSISLREGLPVNIIEAKACGIPIVCSDNRDHSFLMYGKNLR